MARALIGLGSNLGDREAHLRDALARLERDAATRVEAASSLYETAPVGGPHQGPYLNACARLETGHPPEALLGLLLEVERAAGRERSVRGGPRTLDLDLLLYGDRVVRRPGLRIPHPRMTERRFVLVPAREVAPAWRHPLIGVPLRELPDPEDAEQEVRPWAPAGTWSRAAASRWEAP